MDITQTQLIGVGLFFFFVFVSGFLLVRSGKPYGVGLLTVHKLLSVAVFVFLIVIIWLIYQEGNLGTTELVFGLMTGSFFVDSIASGALLTLERPMPAAVLLLHRISPFLAALGTAATLYLLVG